MTDTNSHDDDGWIIRSIAPGIAIWGVAGIAAFVFYSSFIGAAFSLMASIVLVRGESGEVKSFVVELAESTFERAHRVRG